MFRGLQLSRISPVVAQYSDFNNVISLISVSLFWAKLPNFLF